MSDAQRLQEWIINRMAAIEAADREAEEESTREHKKHQAAKGMASELTTRMSDKKDGEVFGRAVESLLQDPPAEATEIHLLAIEYVQRALKSW